MSTNMPNVVWQTTDVIDPEAVSIEDSGTAMITGIADNQDSGFFVRLHSWAELDPTAHDLFKSLIGKTVRVTVEVIG